ncbi:hypothetical protein VTL71DRAFT_1911 [Oculimacula yallundae]|uniref:Heterokaryon incompatibility domain-containing protein n=1 Tax=Oculimacula yallundae TaxID=86028 RepID=A0ABR4CDZ7_9HELO
MYHITDLGVDGHCLFNVVFTSPCWKAGFGMPIGRPSSWYKDFGKFLPDELDARSRDTSSKQSILQVEKWLHTCLTTHRECRSQIDTGWLPSRLLDLEGQSSWSQISLISTAQFSCPPPVPYATLSHCWGKAQILTLTIENKSALEAGIPIQSLPRSFRHAVSVAKRLDIRYLWIDSLCIIQNSSHDWESESLRMGDVYKHALLNIATTGAIDSSEGIFFDRNLSEQLPRRVETSWEEDKNNEEVFVIDREMWKNLVDRSPLLSRAWVYQERLLAQRIVHFGRKQIAWECQELTACESLPSGLPRYIFNYGRNMDIHRSWGSFDGRTDQEVRQHYLQQWELNIERYSILNLTCGKDKEAAIAGIGQVFESLLKDTLVAGLWSSNLVNELLWQTSNAEMTKVYRAPSWSWLAYNGKIFTSDEVKTEPSWKTPYSEVLDVQIHRGSANPLAPIIRGHLRIKGVLRRLKNEEDGQLTTGGIYLAKDLLRFDCKKGEQCPALWLLLIVIHRFQEEHPSVDDDSDDDNSGGWNYWGEGLMLTKSRAISEDVYQRAGRFYLFKTKEVNTFLRPNWERATEPGSQHRVQHTIDEPSVGATSSSDLRGSACSTKEEPTTRVIPDEAPSDHVPGFDAYFERLHIEDLDTQIITII